MKTKIYLLVALFFILVIIATVLIQDGNLNGIYFYCGALAVYAVGTLTNLLTKF